MAAIRFTVSGRVRHDSTSISPLLTESFSESQPALSPDGRWLAYSSNETGISEVYVRPFPNVNGGRWQVSRDGGNEPLWAHSGRELFFRGRGVLVAARVNTAGTFTLGEQRSLFATNGLFAAVTTSGSGISSDDQRFLFLRRVQRESVPTAGPTELIRVENWLAELSGKR